MFKQGNKKQKLGATFILIVCAVLIVTMGASTFYHLKEQHNHEIQKVTKIAESFSEFISLISGDAILSSDFLLLNQYIQELTKIESFVFGVVISRDNNNLTSYLDTYNKYIQKYNTGNVIQTVERIKSDPNIIIVESPVHVGERIGKVIVGVSKDRINETLQRNIFLRVLEALGIIVLLSAIIYFTFRQKAIKPLKGIIDNIKQVTNGNYSSRVPEASSKEFEELAESLNKMIVTLHIAELDKVKAFEDIIEANEKLESATKAKSAFLANMSHEIRTPLTAIIGFGQALIDDDNDSVNRDDAIYSIIKNGKHLHHIINDILDMSKIEAEKIELEYIPVSLFELLHDLSLLLDIQGQEKGVSTYINYRYPLPETIYSDPVRIKQVLINLCNNAIKFTDKGSVSIDVAYDKFKNLLQFDVVDTGVGLDQEQQLKIFDAFTQADASTTRKYGGTGLGLPLSKQLSNMLGGDITVESEPGQGSRFVVTISAGNEEKVYVHRKPAKHPVKPSTDKNDQVKLEGRILLAEDNLDNQVLISFHIKHTGAELTIVENGQEAVAAASKNDYDLILMDMQMPVMDGVEAVMKLRSQTIQNQLLH